MESSHSARIPAAVEGIRVAPISSAKVSDAVLTHSHRIPLPASVWLFLYRLRLRAIRKR